MALDFPSRVALITQGVTRFLRQYRQPEHLTDEAALAVVRTIAEALNARISSSFNRDALVDTVDRTCREVAASYRGKEWPVPAHFVAAIPKRDHTEREDSEWKLDPSKIAASRIREGEPVGEGWLWGRLSHEMIARGFGVTERDLEPFRRAHAAKLRETYGAETAERMLADLNARHEAAR